MHDVSRQNRSAKDEIRNDAVNRDMVSYYRDRAEEYDRSAYSAAKWPQRQTDIEETTRILHKLFAGKRVLEIAAGTGFWTECIAQVARSVTATDINQSVLDVAQAKQYPKGVVTFRAADLYSLGDLLPHEGLFGGFIVSHILKQDLEKFVAAIHEYVIPGGTIVLMDNVKSPDSEKRDRVDERGNNYRMRTLEDGGRHEIVKNYPTENELRELLRDRAEHVVFKKLEHYWVLMYQTLRS